MLPVSNWNIPR